MFGLVEGISTRVQLCSATQPKGSDAVSQVVGLRLESSIIFGISHYSATSQYESHLDTYITRYYKGEAAGLLVRTWPIPTKNEQKHVRANFSVEAIRCHSYHGHHSGPVADSLLARSPLLLHGFHNLQ